LFVEFAAGANGVNAQSAAGHVVSSRASASVGGAVAAAIQ
jgi:hypothetical protein